MADLLTPVAWVAADTLNSPHPTCVSSLAYMSQLDKDQGREYVPLYAAPVAAQTADDAELSLRQQYEDACISANANALDAARYRWLRAMATQQADSLGPIFRIDVRRSAPYLFNFDAAIDAAMQRTSGDKAMKEQA